MNPINVSLAKCEEVGVLLKEDNEKKSYQNLVICETVSQFDKKRIYLRSSVKVVNELNIDFDLKFQNDNTVLLKPKSQYFVPLMFIRNEVLNIRPKEYNIAGNL